MAKFHVKCTFQIEDRDLFVMAGSILEGEVRKGMLAHVSLNSTPSICEPIHAIEFARRKDGLDDICLCFRLDEETREFVRALNISDEIVEIKPEPND